MTKFIIDKINIEKSDKDIQTGVSYEFTEAFNLICGNNEAGKSSLMQFIKEGFFRLKKTDTGKIFFSVDKKQYRADIKSSNKKAERCKLYDNNGLETAYEILEKFINQKYFEQGFTINIDDLMSLKYDNETSLINVIKDPSGDKLNFLLQPFSSKISECIGDKGKPKKILSDITNKISELNRKINELLNKENEYINVLATLKHCDKELKNLHEKEKYITSLTEKRDNNKKINQINIQIQEKNSEFNAKLYQAGEEYVRLAGNIGKYEYNLESTERIKLKLENAENKIKEYITILRNNFGISANTIEFADFNIDYEKINKIKLLFEDINIKNAEIKAYEKNIEDIKENILKLENDYKFIQKNIKNLSSDEISSLFSMLDNGLKQIKSIEYDISETEKEKNTKKGIVIFERFALSSAAFISIIISAYFLNINKIVYSCIFFAIFISLIFLIYNAGRKLLSNEKIERKQALKNNIIKELCAKIKVYYPELLDADGFFVISKLDEIKQEFKNNIDKITQNRIDNEFNQSKLQNTKDKIKNINDEIKKTEQIINELTDNNIITDAKTYLESVNIIQELKNEIINKSEAGKELEKLNGYNTSIINEFNSFLQTKEINIPLSGNFKTDFEELTKYIEYNNNIKKELDTLNILKENLKQDETIQQTETEFEDITISSDLENLLKETEEKKQTAIETKQSMEVQKRLLEEVESLVDIKNERNVKLDEYRTLIKEIIAAKAVMNIASAAKNSFDKTQPDLVNAQKYLSLLTNGRYTKINLGMQEISDETQTVIKKWEELSRGTKEQLYLALRLGYASNYTNKDNKRPDLPLIIDDAFVNFDKERTLSALKCLIEFSKTNQVIFFTCHSETVINHIKSLGYNDNINIIKL